MRTMSTLRTKIGTGATLAALGGLSAYAVASQPTDASPTAPKPASVEVRTQVERRVVHKTRHAKPRRVAVASQSGPGRARPAVAAAATAATGAPAAPAAPAVPAPSSSGPSSTSHSGGADDGPNHDVGDDHGGEGEDHSGHGGGDDGGEDHSGHGGGDDD
jgi:hypothetical protein